MERLDGRVAVVTGAASGIGNAMARRFAAEGMKVVLADVEADALRTAESELAGTGADVTALHTDVSDAAAVDALAEAAYDGYGAVHVVCNNAGVAVGGLSWEVSLEDWDWILGVNLMGVVHGIRSFLPRMIAGGDEGHVVNTASVAGLISVPYMAPYNVTKHAVVTLSETLRADLKVVNARIGVSVLCPAWVQTRIHESERNRPAAASTQEDPLTEMFRSAIGQLVASGMEPGEVASEVVDAIRADRFYVKTHPGQEPAIRARMEAVVAGSEPPLFNPAEIASR